MPSSDDPRVTSSCVQRATRLNGLEQVRLQQRLQLLDKARLRQARLTNQDIRLTSAALDYVLNSSGHSPEGRDPAAVKDPDLSRPQLQFFLYGERVLSRKVRRILRPRSAVEQPSREASSDLLGSNSTEKDEDVHPTRTTATPRPHSSPARGRTWIRPEENSKRSGDVECERQPSCPSSAPGPGTSSSQAFFNRGMLFLAGEHRETPHQAWEDDVHEVTKKLLQARQQQLPGTSAMSRGYPTARRPRVVRDLVAGAGSAVSSAYISYPGPSVSGAVSPVFRVKDSSSRSVSLVKKRPKSSSTSGSKGSAQRMRTTHE